MYHCLPDVFEKFPQLAYTISSMDSVHNADKFGGKAARAKPSQARGKERVRVILVAAQELFQEHGMEQVTTNDIAEKAQIPIGSLYRYYPNKNSIVDAIIDLYMDDFALIFKELATNPKLKHQSWEEVITAVVEVVNGYAKRNGSFMFLFAMWSNPVLYEHSRKARTRCLNAFASLLRKRYPELTRRQALLCFNLTIVTMKMAMSKDDQRVGGTEMLQDAVRLIASYLDRTCRSSGRGAEDMLLN